MENEEKIRTLEMKIIELETKLNSLFSISDFPLDIENILIKRGFYNIGDKELVVYYESGVGGQSFTEKYRTTKYREKNEYQSFSNSGLKPYTVNTTSNVCNSTNHGFTDGQYIVFRTTDTIPGGLDSVITTYWVLNATADTFQVTSDGVNPIDITSSGAGEQYAFVY